MTPRAKADQVGPIHGEPDDGLEALAADGVERFATGGYIKMGEPEAMASGYLDALANAVRTVAAVQKAQLGMLEEGDADIHVLMDRLRAIPTPAADTQG